MTSLVAVMVLLCSPAQAPAPSVAVFTLQTAGSGVDEKTAQALTGAIVSELRKQGAFSRVVSSSELEALMGFERQKQLLDCNASSCMTEIAGSLGVDFLVVGSIAKLASSWLFNLKLINTQKATAVVDFGERLKGADEDAVLDVIPRAVAQIAGAVKQQPRAEVEPPAPAAKKRGPNVPVLTAGGAGLGVGALVLLGGAALLVGAVAIKAFINVAPVNPVTSGNRLYAAQAAYLGMGALGGLMGLLSVVSVVAGAALLAAGVLL